MNRLLTTRISALMGLPLALALACAPATEEEATATASADTPPATSTPADAEADARAFSEQWDASFQQGDADAMAAMFTEDAVRLAADEPIQRGRAAIREGFAQLFAESPPVSSSNPITELRVAGDWAWSWGTFDDTLRNAGTGEETRSTGRWLSILRRTDDGWRYELDAWNTGEPSPGEAEPLTAHTLSTGEGRVVGPSADVEAIEANVRAWEAAAVANDLDAQMARYAADAVRINDRGPVDEGAAAIRATYGAGVALTEADAVIDAIEVDGDWAWVRGRWGVTGEDGAHDMGKWVSVMQRTAEGWKVAAELWNRDQPPPSPAEG